VGLSDLLKRVFSTKAPSIDYSHLSREEIERLAAERASLTRDANAALEVELDRRGMGRPAPEEPPKPEPAPIPKDHPAIEGDPIIVLERRGILLRTQARAAAMLLLPLWSDEPFDIERSAVGANVTELIVFNHGEEGFLPTAFVADKLTVPAKWTFVLDPDRAADRPMPGVRSTSAIVGIPLPAELDLGWLHLERSDHPGVLVATWDHDDIDLCVAIGPAVPLAIFREYEGITHVIGGIASPTTDDIEAIADPRLYADLSNVILLLDTEGASPWPDGVLPFEVATVGRARQVEPVLRAKTSVDLDRWDDVEALVDELSADEIEDLVDGLILERNLGSAARVLDLALASEDWRDDGRIRFLRGVVHFSSGEIDAAVVRYRSATEGPDPEPRAYANLSAIHRGAGRTEEAIASAQLGVDAMPADPISRINLAAALADAGQLDEARSAIDAGEAILGVRLAEEWRARLDAWHRVARGPDEMPHLASKAYRVGCELAAMGRVDASIDMLRRSLELQPTNLEAMVELGAVLSSAGRDEEALRHYDRELAHVPGLAFLRFNRANCLVRLGRVAEAIPELRRLIQEVPTFEPPYLNLVAILLEKGDRTEARHIVDALASAVPDSEHLEALRSGLG
jgi:tetratricopeptide (TPR) repeat protein